MKIERETYIFILAGLSILITVSGYWLIMDNLGILPAVGVFLIMLAKGINTQLDEEDKKENK
jgi:cell division protein FtsW (lipid II flippase)